MITLIKLLISKWNEVEALFKVVFGSVSKVKGAVAPLLRYITKLR